MSNDNPPVTLPILDAFAWLHERGLNPRDGEACAHTGPGRSEAAKKLTIPRPALIQNHIMVNET
jgi:hypothetical protein